MKRVFGGAGLLLLTASASASEGAAYLKIPPGAASTAMGSAMAAWHGIESLWYTPAGLAGQDKLQFSLSRNAWLGQTRNDYLAAALPLGPGGLGAWANYVGTEDVYRDANGVDQGSFGVYDLSGGLAYGWNLGFLSLGAGAKYFQERVESMSSANWAADLGAQVNLGTPRARLGLAVQNLGPRMDYDTALGEVKPPLTYRAGVALDRIGGFLTVLQELRMLPESGEASYLAGGEVQGRAGQLLIAGRAGFDSSAQVIGGGLAGFTLGAGAVLGPLHVDLALAPYGQLGSPYRLSVGWDIEMGQSPAPKPLAVLTPQPQPSPVMQPQPAPAPLESKQAAITVELPDGAAVLGSTETFASAEAAWTAGKGAEAAGHLEQARDAYTAATHLDPNSFEAWGRLGKFEYGQGRKASALPAFERMQALKPDPDFQKWLDAYKAEP